MIAYTEQEHAVNTFLFIPNTVYMVLVAQTHQLDVSLYVNDLGEYRNIDRLATNPFQTVYSVITYVGYIGALTGQKPKKFSITLDERDQGNILENLLVGILDRKTDPVSFLVRDALANDDTFESAISRLAYTPTSAPVYFIIAGVSPGEGAVITKGRLGPDDIWRLDPSKGRWYVVETNYDHWTTPPPSDNRRTPAIHAMNAMGQKGISVQSLFNVMSTHLVLNNHTTYTIVMSPAQPDIMTTWIRL